MIDEPDTTATEALAQPQQPSRRRWPFWLGGLLLALIAWNVTVTIPVASAHSGDDAHTLVAYRRWLVSPDQIVLDVWKADPQSSMADMDRLLFKAAEALKDREFGSVVLAWHGSGRFVIDGSHFQTVGKEYSWQNPVYTMRTFTEHVATMDGSPAFGTWKGGWLGVLGNQLDDHNEFHQQWWTRSAMGIEE